MQLKKINLFILLIILFLAWLAYSYLYFDLKWNDVPSYAVRSENLAQPNSLDSLVITPPRDQMSSIIFLAIRQFYLRGENDSSLEIEIVCLNQENVKLKEFKASLPVNKLDDKTSQEVKINPPLNCKDQKVEVSFKASPGLSEEDELSINIEGTVKPQFKFRFTLKQLIREADSNFKRDNKFRILYYLLLSLGVVSTAVLFLFESKDKKNNRNKR